MTRYSAFARKPAPGSDYEFYVAGFEALNYRTHSSYLIGAAHSYDCGPNPLADYLVLLRDRVRLDVEERLAQAGIFQAQIQSNPALSGIVDELVNADQSYRALVDVWSLSTDLGSAYVVPPHCQVMSEAVVYSGSTRGAIEMLNRNAPRSGGLTKDHLRRGKSSFTRHIAAWFQAAHMSAGSSTWQLLNVLMVRAAWFSALVEIRNEAAQHPDFKKLRGRTLAEAIDHRHGFARAILECVDRADRRAGRRFQTFHALSALDLVLPKSQRPVGLAGAI